MRALVLQHIECEPPGVYEDVLRERSIRIERVELDRDEPLPAWRDFDALIAMGGPMSVNDDAELPWLTQEKRTIAEAVPAYEESLERVQGPGALPRLIGDLEQAADGMRARGRTLFERWLDRAAPTMP